MLVDVQRQIPVAQTMQETLEVPLLQFTDKVVDNPVVAQKQISMETVQKSIEISQLQYCDEVVDIPAVLVVEQVPHVHVVAKTPEIPQLQITDKVIDVPVVSAMQVPRVCAVKKTAETPQLPRVKKFGVIPETIEIPLGNNSGSSVGSTQQQHNHHRKQQRQQARQTEEEEKEEGERRKGERGKEEERDAEEEECKQVKKDATGWTVVTRNKRQRKMVQTFVKVDGGKTSVMEVEVSDRVDDIVKKTPISDQDVYVTSGGRVSRRNDKLESCEVRDGSTVEVMNRMRGGDKHKDKKSKSEKKQTTNTETRAEARWRIEERRWSRDDTHGRSAEAVRRKRRVSEECRVHVRRK